MRELNHCETSKDAQKDAQGTEGSMSMLRMGLFLALLTQIADSDGVIRMKTSEILRRMISAQIVTDGSLPLMQRVLRLLESHGYIIRMMRVGKGVRSMRCGRHFFYQMGDYRKIRTALRSLPILGMTQGEMLRKLDNMESEQEHISEQ